MTRRSSPGASLPPAAPSAARRESGRSLVERLRLKVGRTFHAIDPPATLAALLGAVTAAEIATADVLLVGAADRAAFEAALPPTAAAMRADAILWLAYPKLTSPLARDLSRDRIRAAAAACGLATVAQIAIDDDWSALRLKRVG